MDHGLLVAGLVVGHGVGVLLERLADAGDVAVAEDAEAACEEALLRPVPFDVLVREEPNQRLGHRESYRAQLPHLRFVVSTIVVAFSPISGWQATFVVLPPRTGCSVHLLIPQFSRFYTQTLAYVQYRPLSILGASSTTASCSSTYQPEYPASSSTSSSRPTSRRPRPGAGTLPFFAASLKSSSLLASLAANSVVHVLQVDVVDPAARQLRYLRPDRCPRSRGGRCPGRAPSRNPPGSA